LPSQTSLPKSTSNSFSLLNVNNKKDNSLPKNNDDDIKIQTLSVDEVQDLIDVIIKIIKN